MRQSAALRQLAAAFGVRSDVLRGIVETLQRKLGRLPRPCFLVPNFGQERETALWQWQAAAATAAARIRIRR